MIIVHQPTTNFVDRQNQTHAAPHNITVFAFPEDDVRSSHSVCV